MDINSGLARLYVMPVPLTIQKKNNISFSIPLKLFQLIERLKQRDNAIESATL